MSTAISELIFEGAGYRRALTIKRHAKAKGLRLRVDPRDGRVLLTMPKHGNLEKARKWAETKRDWVESQIAKMPQPRPILAGATIPYRGRDVIIDWDVERPRGPVLAGDLLLIGGPASELQNRVLRWLKFEAREQLQRETVFYAERAGVSIGRVSIGDARTRWGSCSSSGAIRYSWRLILAPPDVLAATAAHEVAHRVHMNHSRDFHALVESLFGRDPAPERRWLRDNGAALYRVGCSS